MEVGIGGVWWMRGGEPRHELLERLGYVRIIRGRGELREETNVLHCLLHVVVVSGEPPHHGTARVLQHVPTEIFTLAPLVFSLVLPDILFLTHCGKLLQSLLIMIV